MGPQIVGNRTTDHEIWPWHTETPEPGTQTELPDMPEMNSLQRDEQPADDEFQKHQDAIILTFL